MTGFSKFDGMDRDQLFNQHFVTRLGLNRHIPIQDALLYILEELNRMNDELTRKESRIQYLEYEVQQLKNMNQKLGPGYGPNYPNWDPYKSPFTYGGPISTTSTIGGVAPPSPSDDVTIGITHGGTSATEIKKAYDKLNAMGIEVNKKGLLDDSWQALYNCDV